MSRSKNENEEHIRRVNMDKINGLMVILDGIVILGQDGNNYKISADAHRQLTTQQYIFPA